MYGGLVMNHKKEERVIRTLTVVEAILLLVAYVVFTIIFRLDKSTIRYFFLAADVYIVFSFSKLLAPFNRKNDTVVVKNAKHKVMAKYASKIVL